MTTELTPRRHRENRDNTGDPSLSLTQPGTQDHRVCACAWICTLPGRPEVRLLRLCPKHQQRHGLTLLGFLPERGYPQCPGARRRAK
ncbi:hypothetical protein NDU88_006638 [Pleurodeles waltl]|uniref:Uncharacterized protein n=1 Tax=Pleurodeles waltl TaxID=8319 RepID=A0AAV7RQT5_PLEWA|nr:hypothetical protein NDU88_006638 [Pleurodeles waltl]